MARVNGAPSDQTDARSPRLAAIALVSFLATFLAARVTVLLIMTRRMPDLYLYVGGTHVHHLNYGIFLLAGVGGYLLLTPPAGRRLKACAAIYGVGLALTFDEFGMWVHLGGSYWQRASFDAVVVVAAVLALVAGAPYVGRLRRWHAWATAVLVVGVVVFGSLLRDSLRHAGERVGPHLRAIERSAPQ